MYIEAIPNRNSPPAVLLREAYREDGKVMKRTLANISSLPTEVIEGLKVLLKGGVAVLTRVPVLFGLPVFAYSSFLMQGVDTNTSFLAFAWWLVLGRIGLAFIMTSLNAGALSALPMRLLGQGPFTINFIRQLGSAFGVNLLAMLLESRSQLYAQAFTAAQDAGNESTAALLRGIQELLARAGVPEAIQRAGAANFLGRVIYVQGNMLGYRDCFLVVAVTFLLALIPGFMMRGSSRSSSARNATPRRQCDTRKRQQEDRAMYRKILLAYDGSSFSAETQK